MRLTCPLEIGTRFCVSRKGETGKGGWVHPKGANRMAVSGLCSRMTLVGTRRAISVLFGISGPRIEPSYLVGPPFSALKAPFFSYTWLASTESLD